MEAKRLEALKQIAAGIAAQFGDKCEVVIHDVGGGHPEHTIVHIENGHVSGRKVGDGASQVVLDQLQQPERPPQGSPVLPDTDAGRQDPEVVLHLHPQQPRQRHQHLLHQLRYYQYHDDASGAGRVHDDPGQGADRAGEDHQRQQRAGRADRAVRGSRWASLWR